MFKRLFNSLSRYYRNYTVEHRRYLAKLNDLDRFNDDFAKSIAWTPIVKSRIRTSFSTKRLVKSKDNIVSFKPSIQFLLFNTFFIGVPSIILVKSLIMNNFNYDDKWLIILFLSVFILLGITYLLWGLKPISFDLNIRRFIKYTFQGGYEKISIDDIYALQMIEDMSSQDETYYELNLVMKNQNRINIICHNDDKAIRKQAKELSKIVSIPFWDMTSF